MKVCFLCEYFYPDSLGGAGTVVSDLARALQDGFPDTEISVVCSDNFLRGAPTKTLARRENWRGLSIRRVRTPRTKSSSGLQRLVFGSWLSAVMAWKLLVGPRFDVLVATTNPPMIPGGARLVSRLRGAPYVFLVHDLYAEMSVVLGQNPPDGAAIRVAQKMQSWFLSGAARVVALGRCMKTHLDQNFDLPPDKVRVIPNWGTIESPIKREESRFRARHGWENKFVALYAGNFGQFHKFDSILDAAKILGQTRSDIVFAFVGAGAKREEVEARARREGIENAQFFPFVPAEELPDLLGACDLALVTLEPGTEGLAVPSKFYNILAAGRATLALMGELAETARVVAEEKCGLRVDGDDARALAKAVATLADSPRETRLMGERARAAFERAYTLKLIAHKFHELLSEVTR